MFLYYHAFPKKSIFGILGNESAFSLPKKLFFEVLGSGADGFLVLGYKFGKY